LAEKRIPFGNDRQEGKNNSNSKGKGKCRFPSGMTDRKAKTTAKTKAKAKAKADSLRE
jgi:hypothetical protein